MQSGREGEVADAGQLLRHLSFAEAHHIGHVSHKQTKRRSFPSLFLHDPLQFLRLPPRTLGWSRNEDSVEWPSQPQKLLLLLLLSMWEPSPQTTHSNFIPSWSSSILLRICCWIWSSALSVCLAVFSRIDKFDSHPIHKCLAPTHPPITQMFGASSISLLVDDIQ
jgi:hypothetical protein